MEKKEITNRIIENIRNGKNSLIWKKNTLKHVPMIRDKYKYTVYINETDPLKSKMAQIIIEVSRVNGIKNIEDEDKLLKMNKEQLKKLLFTRVRKNKTVIVFNHFERLTRTSAQYWGSIAGNKHIIFVGSQFGSFKSEAYGFYQFFELINKDEAEEARAQLNVTIPVLIFLGIFALAFMVKIAYISTNALFILFFAFSFVRFIAYFAK